VGKLTAAGKHIDVISLNSTGGQLGEGALIAEAIKARGLATLVEDGAVCASACFLAFAAGDPQTAHPNAYIGVHKAADNDGRETYKSREATRAMVEFARQLGCHRPSLTRWAERHRTASSGSVPGTCDRWGLPSATSINLPMKSTNRMERRSPHPNATPMLRLDDYRTQITASAI
jgi:hypothetical protein